ncbi:MAG: XrtA/PEP-CTERM system TPR-repeat protein PrsT, partial [Burkholderiaceae bacterium]
MAFPHPAPRRPTGLPRTAAAALAIAVLLAGCGPRPDALRERAREALVKGELRVAEGHAKKLLQERPDDPIGRAILAETHAANDDPRSAEKEWLRALEAGYDPDRGVPGLLAARVSNGDAVGTIDAAGRYRVGTPSSRAAVDYWVGRAHLIADRPAQAEASWRAALELQPENVSAQVGLLGLRASRGEGYAVLTELDALLARAPRQPDALLLKADLQRARKDVTGARRTLEQAVAASPASVSARAALVSVLAEAGDLPAAEAAFTVLRERAPRHPSTRYLRAVIDVKLERLDAARDSLFAVLEQTPDDLRATALAAQVALRQDAIEQAETFARRILDRAPGSKEGATILATVAMRRGEPDRALQVLRATLERSGDDATLLALAGEAALRGEDPVAAIAWFERATRLDPTDAAKRSGLGLALLAAGRTDAGFSALETAVELDNQSSQADLALITARLRAGQHVQALAAIDRLQRKQPRQALPLNLRGTALLARGDYTGARAAFEAALKLEPNFFPAAANLAELDLRERKPGQARGRLEALAREQPGDVRAGLALAQLLGRTGASSEDVIAVLRRTAAAAPRSNEAVVALARALIDADRARDAVPLLQDLEARKRDDRGLIELLSTALLRAKEPQQAVETFERAVRLDPASPFAHLRLAELRASIGDEAGARSAWRSVADLELKVRSAENGLAATLVRAGRRADIARVAGALREQAPSSP